MTMKDKLEPTLVAWILYDTTTDKKYIKMNPADGSLAIFDSEEAAIAAKKTHYGTDYKRCEYYSAPAVQEVFCEDTVLSLAERTFSAEVDEQLAEDIIQYARRLHSRYTAPQHPSTKCPGAGCTDQGCPAHYANDYPPIPEVAKLVEALEEMVYVASMVDGWESFPFYPMERAEEALALYRKQGGEL